MTILIMCISYLNAAAQTIAQHAATASNAPKRCFATSCQGRTCTSTRMDQKRNQRMKKLCRNCQALSVRESTGKKAVQCVAVALVAETTSWSCLVDTFFIGTVSCHGCKSRTRVRPVDL